MDFLRYLRSQPSYNPETRHCLYGLDTDLIMLGLVTHEPYFSLLREEILFKRTAKRPTCPEQTTFFLLHLRLFREYLEFEFRDLAKSNLPFEFDIERVIDDWILIEFLIGNDFIPHVPDCHVASNDLPELWKIYREVLPTLDGYMNECGRLNLKRFEKFIKALADFDRRKFESRFDDLKYMNGKKQSKVKVSSQQSEEAGDEGDDGEGPFQLVSKNERQLMKQLMPWGSGEDGDDDDDDGIGGGLESDDDEYYADCDNTDEEEVAFKSHKRDYYRSKMQLAGDKPMKTNEFVKLQVASYIEALEWTLRYYYEGVPSWSWFYPFHYAPYLSDMKSISELKLDFNLGKPFHPFEQLMSVLPAASKKLLPASYRNLMTSEHSSLREFYPEDFSTDLNGKALDWEAVVLIPFIEENQLLKAIRPLEATLTPQEKERNSRGTINVFRFSGNTNGTVIQSSLPFIPKYTNVTKIENLPWDKFQLFPEKVNHEYPRECLASLKFVPNFPTFKHMPCHASLYAAGTSVFKMPSRNLNMIVKLNDDQMPSVEGVESIAAAQIGSVVLVNWPFLQEARVVSISTLRKRYTTDADDYSTLSFNVITSDHDAESSAVFNADLKYCRKHFYDIHGLDFRACECVLYAVTLTGIRYSENENKELIAVKVWSNTPQPFPYEGVVFDLRKVAPPDSLLAAPPVAVMTTKLGELYPMGESVFVVSDNYFGRMGIVIGYDERRNSVKVRVRMLKQPIFEDLIYKLQTGSAGVIYNPGHQMSRQVGVGSYLFSKITGCLRVKKQARDDNNGEVVKVNIGLDLKNHRDNLRLPGYTLRDQRGSWLYSEAAVDLVRLYKRKFPILFKNLQELMDRNAQEPFNYDDVFSSNDVNNEQMGEVCDFIRALPHSKLTPVPNDSFILEEELVAEVDKIVQKKSNPQFIECFLKPDYLYRPKLTNRVNLGSQFFGNNGENFNLLDRVVCIASSHSVPLGLEGTIIGVVEEKNTSNPYDEKPVGAEPKKVTYEVLFDSEFQHGATIRCPEKRGYRMFPQNLLGIKRGTAKRPVQNFVKEAAAAQKEESKTNGKQPSSSQRKQDISFADAAKKPDEKAFWKAVGGSQLEQGKASKSVAGGKNGKKEQNEGPWALIPANLLTQNQVQPQLQQMKGGKQSKRNESGNKSNEKVVPIPPRLILGKQEQPGSLTQILKDVGLPSETKKPSSGGRIATRGVPMFGSAAPPTVSLSNKNGNGNKNEWIPMDLTPQHDWDKLLKGSGIKVSSLPSGHENSKKIDEQRDPLREKQTTGFSGHNFIQMFNGTPKKEINTGTMELSSDDDPQHNVQSQPARNVNSKKPTLAKPGPGADQVVHNLKSDLAKLKVGKPVEFVNSESSRSPETPQRPSKSTPQRLNASDLIASVSESGNNDSKQRPKKSSSKSVDSNKPGKLQSGNQKKSSAQCIPTAFVPPQV